MLALFITIAIPAIRLPFNFPTSRWRVYSLLTALSTIGIWNITTCTLKSKAVAARRASPLSLPRRLQATRCGHRQRWKTEVGIAIDVARKAKEEVREGFAIDEAQRLSCSRISHRRGHALDLDLDLDLPGSYVRRTHALYGPSIIDIDIDHGRHGVALPRVAHG